MKHAIATAAGLLILGIAVVTIDAPGPTGAAFAGANGKIAFQTDRDGNFEIFSMNPDGGVPTNLSNNLAADESPAWSPDGSQIAFTSDRDGDSEMYVMDADGGGLVQITSNDAGDFDPAWSPDGAKIAFDRGLDILVMNTDGSGEVNLTNSGPADYDPAWSPDGSKIAFASRRDGNEEIYVMNADGSDPQNLTGDPASDDSPSWSPDGTRIAFRSDRDFDNEIYTMNADGTGATNLTDNEIDDFQPAWSPDGRKIVFRSDPDVSAEIYIIGVDGTDPVAITDNTFFDFGADWQPLGRLRGDINCDGHEDSVDALLVLRHTAGLAVNLPSGCPSINWPASHGPNPIVSSGAGSLDGTWQFDFDTGTQVAHGDVFWEIIEYIGQTVGDIVPVGDARAVNLGMVDFDGLTHADLWYLPFSVASIHGSDDAGSQLAPGDVFAVLTSDGNVAKVRVEAYGYTLQLRWVTYQGAPRSDMNCDGQVNSVDSLFILRHVAQLPVTLPQGCPAIGS